MGDTMHHSQELKRNLSPNDGRRVNIHGDLDANDNTSHDVDRDCSRFSTVSHNTQQMNRVPVCTSMDIRRDGIALEIDINRARTAVNNAYQHRYFAPELDPYQHTPQKIDSAAAAVVAAAAAAIAFRGRQQRSAYDAPFKNPHVDDGNDVSFLPSIDHNYHPNFVRPFVEHQPEHVGGMFTRDVGRIARTTHDSMENLWDRSRLGENHDAGAGYTIPESQATPRIHTHNLPKVHSSLQRNIVTNMAVPPVAVPRVEQSVTTELVNPHRERRRCTVEDCSSNAVSKGLCKSHGGGQRCKAEGCSKSAQRSGLCYTHGGRNTCTVEGCSSSSVSRGRCKAHGGGRRCRTYGCTNSAVSRSFCYTHGGGTQCSRPGCQRSAKMSGLCYAHGGRRVCEVEGCDMNVINRKRCRRHGVEKLAQERVNDSFKSDQQVKQEPEVQEMLSDVSPVNDKDKSESIVDPPGDNNGGKSTPSLGMKFVLH